MIEKTPLRLVDVLCVFERCRTANDFSNYSGLFSLFGKEFTLKNLREEDAVERLGREIKTWDVEADPIYSLTNGNVRTFRRKFFFPFYPNQFTIDENSVDNQIREKMLSALQKPETGEVLEVHDDYVSIYSLVMKERNEFSFIPSITIVNSLLGHCSFSVYETFTVLGGDGYFPVFFTERRKLHNDRHDMRKINLDSFVESCFAEVNEKHQNMRYELFWKAFYAALENEEIVKQLQKTLTKSVYDYLYQSVLRPSDMNNVLWNLLNVYSNGTSLLATLQFSRKFGKEVKKKYLELCSR